MSLRDRILNAKDRRVEAVFVPEWNVTVYLTEMTVGERSKMWEYVDTIKSSDPMLAPVMLMFTMCDENGERIFGNDDYQRVLNRCSNVVDRLGKRASDINNTVASAVDDAKKNSEETPNLNGSTTCATS